MLVLAVNTIFIALTVTKTASPQQCKITQLLFEGWTKQPVGGNYATVQTANEAFQASVFCWRKKKHFGTDFVFCNFTDRLYTDPLNKMHMYLHEHYCKMKNIDPA